MSSSVASFERERRAESELALFGCGLKRLAVSLITLIIGRNVEARTAQNGSKLSASKFHHFGLAARCGSTSPQNPISTRVHATYTKGGYDA